MTASGWDVPVVLQSITGITLRECGSSLDVMAIITPPVSVDIFSTSAKLRFHVDTPTDRIADMDRLELFLHRKIISHLRLTTGSVAIASDPLSECFLDAPSAVWSSVLSTISAHRISRSGS